METNTLYFSTNTKLAYRINEDYYGGKHFVWCCPVLNPAAENKLSKHANIPPSSNPYNIYHRLSEDINACDRNSSKIKENRKALKGGATIKLKAGVITEAQFGEITLLIKEATFQDFTPYIYVIQGDMVKDRIKKVPVTKTANPLGVEYQIADLDRSEFKILDIQS